jgi:hypothetical protein
MRPHMEELRQALSREHELVGLERDQAEGLAVYLAPAVRDMTIILQVCVYVCTYVCSDMTILLQVCVSVCVCVHIEVFLCVCV